MESIACAAAPVKPILSRWDMQFLLPLWAPSTKRIVCYREEALRLRAEGESIPHSYMRHWLTAEKKANPWWWECCRFRELHEADWLDYHPGQDWRTSS